MSQLDRLEAFARQTGLQGFTFAQEATHHVEKILWYLLIIVGVSLTLQDCYKNIQFYLQEPTTTTLTVIDRHAPPFDNLQFCVPIFTEAIRPDGSWDGLVAYDPVVNSLDVFNATFVDDLLSNLLDIANISELFKSSHYSVPYPPNLPPFIWTEDTVRKIEQDKQARTMLSLTLKMLGQIIRLESDDKWVQSLTVHADTRWGYGSWQQNRRQQYANRADGKFIAPTIKKVYNYYRNSKSFDFLALLKETSVALCKFMSISGSIKHTKLNSNGVGLQEERLTTSTDSSFCHTDNVTYFGRPARLMDKLVPDLACYKMNMLNSSEHQFYDTNDYIGLSAGTQTLFKNDTLLSRMAYLVLSDDAVFDVQGEHIVEIIGGETTVLVTFESVFHAANLGRNPCATTQTFMTCHLECRQRRIAELCKCWPLGLFNIAQKPPGIDYCATDATHLLDQVDYVMPQLNAHPECMEFLDGAVNTSCLSVCYKPCDRKQFKIDIETASKDTSLNFEVKIVSNQFTYTAFVEQLLMDSTTLVSNLGGSMGVWVGASFMALIHVVMFFGRQLFCETTKCKKAYVGGTESKITDPQATKQSYAGVWTTTETKTIRPFLYDI